MKPAWVSEGNPVTLAYQTRLSKSGAPQHPVRGASARALATKKWMPCPMKPATVGYAIYMLMGGLGVIALAIYVQNWIGIVLGVVLIFFAAGFYLAERRSQLPRDKRR